jgi:hypothetical protein
MIPIIRVFSAQILLSFLSFAPMMGQEVEAVTDEWTENLAEDIVSRSEGEIDLTEFLAYLEDLRENPVNLNHAKAEELEELHMLNEFQVASLLDYIKINGELVSIYELQYIPGFTTELAARLKPFVVTSPKDRVIDDLQEISQIKPKGIAIFRTQHSLEKLAGFSKSADTLANSASSYFSGSPGKYYMQYSYQFSTRINAGLTVEKDNGEPFICKGKYPMPDFNSFHVLISEMGLIKKLAVGDFQIGFGQGLTWWSGYGFGKTSSLQNLRRTGQGIKAYSSCDENRFMRGIGTCLGLGKFDLSLFISRKKIDANISKYDSLRNEPVSFSSFQTSGIHSTSSEIADKDAVLEQITGGHLTFRGEHLRIGASLVQTNWNAAYDPLPVSYKVFSFRGKSATNAGIDMEARFGNISLYGELAKCALGGLAFIQGASFDFQHKVYLSVIYRNYSKKYFSPYASAFAESSVPANERGVFTALNFKPAQHLLVTTYLDIFNFPWLKYRLSQPATGSDFNIQFQYSGNNRYSITLRYQEERGMQDSVIENAGVPPVIGKFREKLRLNITVTAAQNLTLMSRLELQQLKQTGMKTEKGYLIFQDLAYKFQKIPLKLVMRYSIFETDSYNSRIYGYESDMLHVYSVPAFSGKGMRYSVLVQYKISQRIDFWLKLGRNLYPDQASVGSGVNLINTNHKTDLGLEIRTKF